MTRQFDNVAGYFVNTNTSKYLVQLKRLKNTYAGTPRFEAVIFDLDIDGEYTAGHVFRFTGHYADEYEEANFIVTHWEKKVVEMCNR